MPTPTKQPAPRRHILDATGKSLGRIATQAALHLQGKDQATYKRHQDVGSWVEIRNLKAAKFTGHKLGQKTYFRYTGYPGGITARSLTRLWEDRPTLVFRNMVYQMLPANRLRKQRIKRLVVKL